MKCPLLLFVLLLPVMLLKSPEVSAEWQKTNLHGPSQVGITDSLAIDVNADGLLDVVAASYDDGTVRAYLNQGRLRFKEQLLSSGMVGAFRLSSADINNDGRPDFLVPSVETSEVYLLLSEQGTYQKQRVTDQVPVPTDALFVDLNGDGVDEIITASFSDDLLMLHERQPTGGYDARILADGIINPRKLLSGDFNGDLRPDLMVASTGDDSLRLLVNGGQMTFTEQLISDTLSAIR